MATIGTLSTYLENKLINHLLRNTAYTPPAGVWVALYTIAPSDTRPGTEVSTVNTGYTRIRIGAGSSISITVSGNSATNYSKIEFPESTGTWGTIVGVAIMDASSDGNILFWGQTNNQVTISTGEIFSIPVGFLIIELSSGTKGGWGNGIPAQILNHVLNSSAMSSPGTSVYAALGKNLVVDTDYNFVSWTEVSTSGGTGYARKQVQGTGAWYSPTNGSTTNLSDVIFANPPIGVDWGAITHVVVFNNSTGGNALLWGKLGAPVWITSGDGFKFAAGNIDVVID